MLSSICSFRFKVLSLVLVLALLLPVLAACDDDDDDGDKTTQSPATTTQPATTTTQPTGSTDLPFVDKPVKIGVIIDYSGPSAMAGWLADGAIGFAEWYWNEKQGGLQVGDVRRPVEFVKYDNQGQVAAAAAAAKKAVLDGVTAVTLGGVATQFGYPVAETTDPEEMLYTTFVVIPSFLDDYKYTVSAYVNYDLRADMIADLIVNDLEAKTVGILCRNLESDRDMIKMAKEKIMALNPEIEIVYEEYPALDVKDLSPFMTKIRYEKPDVLLSLVANEAYTTMAKQMPELGGWGDIKHVAYTEAGCFTGIEDTKGAQGWYIPLMYLEGYGTPAQVEFGKLWAEKCAADSGWCKKYSPTGEIPLPNHPTLYNPMLTTIKAIEMAGTDDRAEVAKAARSGNLEFDSPMGYLKIGTDGDTDLSGFFIQVKDGKLMPLE